MGLGHSPRIVTDGLVLCLDAANARSYPGTGTTWSDLVGTKSATFQNGATFNAANTGSILFDGTNDYLSTNFDPLEVVGTNSVFSLCVYFNASSIPSTSVFLGNVSGNGRYLIGIQNQSSSLYGYYNLNNVTNYGTSQSLMTLNTWNHFTITYDDALLKSYVNGVLVESVSTSSIGFVSWNNMIIGQWTTGSQMLNGKVSSMIHYNRALTADEVRQNYEATKGRYE
jgi:hypothetical protein